MGKFEYEKEGELTFGECQCDFCVYFNNGKRSEICPKELLEKIEKDEIKCPKLKQESIFGD